jgi:hypothetical protein
MEAESRSRGLSTWRLNGARKLKRRARPTRAEGSNVRANALQRSRRGAGHGVRGGSLQWVVLLQLGGCGQLGSLRAPASASACTLVPQRTARLDAAA